MGSRPVSLREMTIDKTHIAGVVLKEGRRETVRKGADGDVVSVSTSNFRVWRIECGAPILLEPRGYGVEASNSYETTTSNIYILL